AVAPLPFLKVQNRFQQVAFAKVRPECGRDPNLAVSNLPEEKIGNAHLAARSNEKVRIRKTRRPQPRPQSFLVDLLGSQSSGGDIVGERPASVDDLCPASVI